MSFLINGPGVLNLIIQQRKEPCPLERKSTKPIRKKMKCYEVEKKIL